MEELVPLPGVGRKTANVVLGNAFGMPGIPVDTHVGRLSRRLGLTVHDRPGEGRARPDGADPEEGVDDVRPPHDLPRPAGLPRPQAAAATSARWPSSVPRVGVSPERLNPMRFEGTPMNSPARPLLPLRPQSTPRPTRPPTTYPSSPGQLELGRLLARGTAGARASRDAEQDEHGIVLATIPATVPHAAPTIAWIAHVDTSPETSGRNVKPIVHRQLRRRRHRAARRSDAR